ncbi:MAG: hypothetical protein ACJAX3_002444 [Patiriisocius sp.]
MLKQLLLLVFLLNFSLGFSQRSIGEDAEISVITIGPGTLLYDSFGHSAFRVKDPSNGTDMVFNYGTFDFDTPNFYIKFARGKLPYALSVRDYNSFIATYKRQKRWVKEQRLNLTYEEKATMFEYLINNAQPEKKEYQYDFFYDNCATKMRDVVYTVLNYKLVHNKEYVTTPYTFRELIQQRLQWNTWGSLGIDIALGAVIDRAATPTEHQFLPEYIFKAAAVAEINREGTFVPLVKQIATTYDVASPEKKSSFITSPFFVFCLIAIFIFYITCKDITLKKRTRWLDSALFLITGLVGILLLTLWLGTDHTATANNYNVLWAFPLNLFFFVLIHKVKPKTWLYRYVFFLILLFALLTFHWISGVQIFAIALLPFLFALAFRWVYLALELKGK